MIFYKIYLRIIKYFDQSDISQSRSFSHLGNFSVGKEIIHKTFINKLNIFTMNYFSK